MSPVLSLTTIFLQKNCDFLPLCGAPTQTTNLTINVIKERHAVCHRCLPCHYSTTTEHKLKKMTKYGACSFDVFLKLKTMSILIFQHPTLIRHHRLFSQQKLYFQLGFLPFANSISGLSVSRFFVLKKLIWFLMRKAITNNEVQFSSKVFDMQDEDVKAVSHDFLFVIRTNGGLKDNLFVDRSSHSSPLDRAFMLWELRKGRPCLRCGSDRPALASADSR